MLATLAPALPARAAPKIEFLNPSGYSPGATATMSDKADRDGAYHLVAWVSEVPANPFVEFEFTSATGFPNITIEATRVGNDTWEAFFSLSGIDDGQYILRAILYENFTGPGTGSDVAIAEQNVTVDASEVPPPGPANTVEMTYPDDGGALGFFNPKGKPVNFLVDGIASVMTDQVRVLYTTTAPGSAPAWTVCGFAQVPSDFIVGARCTLAEGTGGSAVTAVAMVANETPAPADPSDVADATGDAHRVAPYAQSPTRLTISPDTLEAEPGTTGTCPTFIANVHDQDGRPIAAANIDVHATEPDDQIQFGVIRRTTSPEAGVLTSGFQAPDNAHVSKRAARNCGNEEPEEEQGDHNIPGADDPQHIESTAGTNNQGDFTFALWSATAGPTHVDAWADVNDDDVQQASEVGGGARIGWGQPPPAPSRTILLEPVSTTAATGSCQRMVLAAKEGGNPLVSANVDVHASGPNETIAFCSPGSDASTGRAPDQGSHVGDADDAQTRHLEGETDSSGRFIFGVTASSEGTTAVTGWIDSTDDDVLSGEPARNAEVKWTISGDRSISIASSRARVRKGRRVTISGRIDGAAVCEADQRVRLRAKPLSGGRFRTIASTSSDASGSYSFRVKVRKSKRYFTVAPADGACEKAASRRIVVRVMRG